MTMTSALTAKRKRIAELDILAEPERGAGSTSPRSAMGSHGAI
jgi:hypothetical protein